MAKNNYSFEKRQKDIAKKKKQEEKRQKKLNKPATPGEENPETTSEVSENPGTEEKTTEETP
ncbi:hypothetical protein LPTSP3_g03520 [Leptospira kobayashii]|uniref:Uncharacterized protein n=1 Tax=Leptospira kobayashii TaxID=1917830 RepID=A0ABM7UG40_9LEPT|nr:hypothetical protein [Leptospira kobayashii]BDA77422.1 hypothetical protein LPTSP3_g03520 [Leptospira kobayashii]